jgi:hypothetical protein
MGHRNTDAVLLAQPYVNLAPGPWLVLALMARKAHDDTQLYFAGIDWLQLALTGGVNASAERTVMRHLRTLQDSGYVKVLPDKRGRRKVYQLMLPGLP